MTALADALASLLDQDDPPPCCYRDVSAWWLSESADDRARAAQHCHGCAILADCHEAAEDNDERFGTWAGIDRTPKAPKKARKTP